MHIIETHSGAYQALAFIGDTPAEQGELGARRQNGAWQIGLADGDGWLAVEAIAEQRDDCGAEAIRRE